MVNRLRTPLLLLLALLALAPAACGGGADKQNATPTPQAGDSGAATSAPVRQEKPIKDRFSVGDHKLWISCVGGGSPTVIYLHPYAADDSSAGGGDAGSLPELLRE